MSPIENVVRGCMCSILALAALSVDNGDLSVYCWMTTSGRNATAGVGEGCPLTSSCRSMGISELKRTGLG